MIRLNLESISSLNMENYEKNYTITVNGEEYKICRFLADLLSPKINNQHLSDPTNDEFTIKTKNKGNFSTFLKLLSFQPIQIHEQEIPFISEVINIFESNFIEPEDQYQVDQSELTISSAISNLQKHELYQFFYKQQIEQEINFISSHLFEIDEEQETKLLKLNPKIIERIIGSKNILLQSEDQLINIINKLYSADVTFSVLYEYVEFENVSGQIITEFTKLFDVNDINYSIWNQITKRLSKELQEDTANNQKRYNKQSKGIQIKYNENNELNGIINYIRQQTSNNIQNEVSITASSVCNGKVENLLQYNISESYFYTSNTPNSWICIEFKNHTIIPTHYTIRSVPDQKNHHPKTWVIEGSTDNKDYFIIDEQTNCGFLNGKSYVHTFQISKEKQKEIKYFRMIQTGINWYGQNYLEFNAIEVYGNYI